MRSIVRVLGSRVSSPSWWSAAATPAASRARIRRASSSAPSRKPAGTSCTMPKSTKQSANSPRSPGSTSRFPGCGSAWKNACRNTWVAYEPSSASTSRAGSTPARRRRARSVMRIPGRYSVTSTRVRVNSGTTAGMRTPGVPAKLRAMRSALAASSVKSSSRARLDSSWSSRSAKPSEPSSPSIARTATRRVERSAESAARTSGRCTFTATSRPSCRVARCTCASDADAIGRRQTRANSSSGGAPSSSQSTRRTSVYGCGRARSCSRASRST